MRIVDLIHGEQDTLVPIQQAGAMVAKLREAGRLGLAKVQLTPAEVDPSVGLRARPKPSDGVVSDLYVKVMVIER